MKFELKRNISETVGFWGPSTSSVDWCESNYEMTEYMAEFNNTLSSFSLVLTGVLGLIMHPWSEKRFKLAFLTTIICNPFNNNSQWVSDLLHSMALYIVLVRH
jgi:hypothetical protein